ncbi:MAG: hypothetical protein IJT72_04200, partial [Lachnospiraceae bacterium]|nr:hypothetical protein [Lachnospiraceae bacterium]
RLHNEFLRVITELIEHSFLYALQNCDDRLARKSCFIHQLTNQVILDVSVCCDIDAVCAGFLLHERSTGCELFLGANIDAVSVANQFGVSKNRAVRYECDSAGTKLNFEVMTNLLSRARACESSAMMAEDFADEALLGAVKEDYKKRHKA